MKTRLFLMLITISLGFAMKANALTPEELSAIGQVLAPSNEGRQEEAVEPIVKENIVKKPDIKTKKEPTILEIFYRLGQTGEKKRPSDPGLYERQAREFDRRIEILFSKENNND